MFGAFFNVQGAVDEGTQAAYRLYYRGTRTDSKGAAGLSSLLSSTAHLWQRTEELLTFLETI